MYHDSNRLPWEIDKRWEDLSPNEWIEVCLLYYQNISVCTWVVSCFCFWYMVKECQTLGTILLMLYQIFEDGIKEPAADHGMVSKWATNRNYLVSPINGVLKYHRLGNQERNDLEVPFEKASLVLADVSLTVTEV